MRYFIAVLSRLVVPLAVAVSLGAAAPVHAQAVVDQVVDPDGPLVYVLSFDAFDGDRLDAGKAPFLSQLLSGANGNRATYYKESRSVMVTDTNPNHVAMATGAFGDTSGIPGNAFAVYGDQARKDCDADPADGTTDGEIATCLLAETFFASAKRSDPGRITTAGIFGKPKLADIFATKRVDANAYDADFLWSPCNPATPTPYCDPSAPARPNDGYAVQDSAVMDVVLRTIDEGVAKNGKQRRPNLTFVNLPTIDAAGHGFGTESGAYDQAIALADAQLERFVGTLQRRGLWARSVLFVVSDHTMDTTMGKTSMSEAFGSDADGTAIVQNGSVDMVYLANRADPNRFAKLKTLREKALATAGVDEALYREPNPLDGGTANTLDGAHPGWRIGGERTGDLFITHAVGGAFSDPANPLTGNHGSSYTSDNTFAVISGGTLVRQQTVGGTVGPRFDDTLLNPGSAQNVDVAPTALALLGLSPPANNQGRVLSEAFEPSVIPQSLGGTGTPTAPVASCRAPSPLVSVGIKLQRGRFAVTGRKDLGRLRIDVLRNGKRIARFRRSAGFRAKAPFRRNGAYVVEVRGQGTVRRFALRRRGGWFISSVAADAQPPCGPLVTARLTAPVARRSTTLVVRTTTQGRFTAQLIRGRRVLRRYAPGAAKKRVRIATAGLKPGKYRVRVVGTGGPAGAENARATIGFIRG